jgi:hypothetical protein
MEIQTNNDGEVGNLVWVYDTLEEAYSKFYSVLSAAAISSISMHSAVLISNDGNLQDQKCFYH